MMDSISDLLLWFLIEALALTTFMGSMGLLIGYWIGRRNRQTKTYEFQIEQE